MKLTGAGGTSMASTYLGNFSGTRTNQFGVQYSTQGTLTVSASFDTAYPGSITGNATLNGGVSGSNALHAVFNDSGQSVSAGRRNAAA